ncbi:MAG: hypothetical protein LBQ03_01930 [Puniceicoccales bacterium]|jgi:hypothetical protein|nr:hypothetical protein [Puniceicoccales bacterium]
MQKDLCKNNDTVILAINGDIFTKYSDNTTIDNRAMGKNFHYTHFFGNGGLLELFTNLTENNPKIQIVFNLGNHEVMKRRLHLLAYFFQVIRNQLGDRFHVVSNLKVKEPDIDPRWEGGSKKGLVDFVRPAVTIAGITFVGYCTTRIFEATEWKGKSLYGYARKHFYHLDGEKNYRQSFVKNVRNIVRKQMHMPVLFILAHEGTGEFRKIWQKVEGDSKNNGNYLSAVKQRIIATGHIHGQSKDRCGLSSSVIIPDSFGRSVEVVELGFDVSGEVDIKEYSKN